MDKTLAVHGGPKAKTTPNHPMYPGGIEIGEEERKLILEVLDRKYLFRYYGPGDSPSMVRELEKEFAAKVGARHALALNSCTSALITALVACGVGPGSEVIVTGYTFFASCAAIVGAKAIPVIAEVDETLTMDPDDFERKITPSTKAVVVVHMRGVPCDMDRIMGIARRHRLRVIEDVAQAVGGTYKGRFGESKLEGSITGKAVTWTNIWDDWSKYDLPAFVKKRLRENMRLTLDRSAGPKSSLMRFHRSFSVSPVTR